ncbi:hypothetical protein EKO27_g6118 [Xylaria grammica]|uniref:SGNH hydrolase-type esterase domain-containing protein n=1 Tax=Xylaria grammica TaxID=363999 RepID=A0A439D3K4_9PEZI|nr:hypothetical protein EKO27_g6118 [Xylaria grammica]
MNRACEREPCDGVNMVNFILTVELTYSFHSTVEVDALPYLDSSSINPPGDGTLGSQQPQDLHFSSDGLLVPEPSRDPNTRKGSVGEHIVVGSSSNSTALGNPVNFIGSRRLGAFKDNDLEAYPDNRIDQIHDHATRIVPSTKPNVIVLHVGSNDCVQKHDTANAGKRVRDLITYLFKTSPQATIVISTLLAKTAEMHCEQGLPDRPLPADISPDGTHPFDHGYRMMADIFFSAFVDADRRGFLKAPEANGIPDNGELGRADDPFISESEPPEKRANPPKDEKKVPPKPAPEVVPRAM